MKIKRGDFDLNLRKKYSRIESVSIDLGGRSYPLAMVSLHTMTHLRFRSDSDQMPMGFPVYACPDGNLLLIHPTADKSYDLEIRYFPPMEVM
jgi:hypothetical protein